MTDQRKTCLSVFAYFSMFVLSFVGFLIGWISWGIRAGVVTALITFAVFFVFGSILLVFVNNLSWITVSLPLLVTTIYSIVPNPPGSIDDTLAMIVGSMLTFVLWLRKQPETPRWIIFPLLIASLYTLVAGFVPTAVDEILVTIIASGTAILGTLKRVNQSKQIIVNESDSDSTL